MWKETLNYVGSIAKRSHEDEGLQHYFVKRMIYQKEAAISRMTIVKSD